ncbi:unnamed protein product [Acanthosepion pharaonis]|uniref:Uncharacterized protein n=1 Tax=Acanthosepion pharaonis TaxID=158019 RepID=A0A812D3K2_ACAPH|nr:unnamed protein product [Sepia pharaonis]
MAGQLWQLYRPVNVIDKILCDTAALSPHSRFLFNSIFLSSFTSTLFLTLSYVSILFSLLHCAFSHFPPAHLSFFFFLFLNFPVLAILLSHISFFSLFPSVSRSISFLFFYQSLSFFLHLFLFLFDLLLFLSLPFFFCSFLFFLSFFLFFLFIFPFSPGQLSFFFFSDFSRQNHFLSHKFLSYCSFFYFFIFFFFLYFLPFLFIFSLSLFPSFSRSLSFLFLSLSLSFFLCIFSLFLLIYFFFFPFCLSRFLSFFLSFFLFFFSFFLSFFFSFFLS